MSEPRKNGYDDDDLKDVLAQIEAFDSQKQSIMAKAAGECGGISKKIADVKTEAKGLNIPLKVLNALLKRRKLERQIAAVNDAMPEDYVEVYEDALGQFSFLQPRDLDGEVAEDDEEDADSGVDEEEQAEGAAVLNRIKH